MASGQLFAEGVTMPGKIKLTIDSIVEKRSRGNPVLANTTRTKLIMKGIDISKYTATSEDDPAVLAKLDVIAKELGV